MLKGVIRGTFLEKERQQATPTRHREWTDADRLKYHQKMQIRNLRRELLKLKYEKRLRDSLPINFRDCNIQQWEMFKQLRPQFKEEMDKWNEGSTRLIYLGHPEISLDQFVRCNPFKGTLTQVGSIQTPRELIGMIEQFFSLPGEVSKLRVFGTNSQTFCLAMNYFARLINANFRFFPITEVSVKEVLNAEIKSNPCA
jgi:hypothetical protein